MPSEAVRKAARLHLVVAGGHDIEAPTGLDYRLREARALAAREEALLAHELERRLAHRHAAHTGHRLVGAQQHLHLVVERDGERITHDRRAVLAARAL